MTGQQIDKIIQEFRSKRIQHKELYDAISTACHDSVHIGNIACATVHGEYSDAEDHVKIVSAIATGILVGMMLTKEAN